MGGEQRLHLGFHRAQRGVAEAPGPYVVHRLNAPQRAAGALERDDRVVEGRRVRATRDRVDLLEVPVHCREQRRLEMLEPHLVDRRHAAVGAGPFIEERIGVGRGRGGEGHAAGETQVGDRERHPSQEHGSPGGGMSGEGDGPPDRTGGSARRGRVAGFGFVVPAPMPGRYHRPPLRRLRPEQDYWRNRDAAVTPWTRRSLARHRPRRCPRPARTAPTSHPETPAARAAAIPDLPAADVLRLSDEARWLFRETKLDAEGAPPRSFAWRTRRRSRPTRCTPRTRATIASTSRRPAPSTRSPAA